MITIERVGVFLLLVLTLTATIAHATWIPDGNLVCANSANQYSPQLIPDGAGGAFIVWTDYRNGSSDIYAQHTNRFGESMWGNAGTPVCTAPDTQGGPGIVSDGNGGVYVIWGDFRGTGSNIYAQHLDENGAALWTTDGLPLAPTAFTQNVAQLDVDGSGGLVAVFGDSRHGGANHDIYAQRLDAGGNRLWGATGLPVCSQGTSQSQPGLVFLPESLDGSLVDRVFVVWQDNRNEATNDADLYAQLLSLAGTPQWAVNGVPICVDLHEQSFPFPLPTLDGDVIVIWNDTRSGRDDVFGQRIDQSGSSVWANDTNITFDLHDEVEDVCAVPADNGGVFVAYSTDTPYARNNGQFLDPNGSRVWPNDTRLSGVTEGPARVASDGLGGALFAVTAPRDYPDLDIVTTRVDGAGSFPWGSDIHMPVVEFSGTTNFEMVYAGGNGVFTCWRDQRYGDTNFDIRVQRLETTLGHWGHPEPVIRTIEDITPDEGGFVRLVVRASDYDWRHYDTAYPVTGYNIWRSYDAKGRMGHGTHASATVVSVISDPKFDSGVVVTGAAAAALRLPPGDWESLGYHAAQQMEEYAFVVPTNTDSTATGPALEAYAVTAHTVTVTVHFTSGIEMGYSVDNLAPGLVQGLIGEVALDPMGLNLSWQDLTASDLANYRVHRGTSEGFVPDLDNLVATPNAPAWFDGEWTALAGFHYKVAGIDRHGNVGGFAHLSTSDISTISYEELPLRMILNQNRPNPFNPNTTITFSLPRQVFVNLSVYDVAGRLVDVLLDDKVAQQGRNEVVWRGRDIAGRALPSGTYFYRLEAGSYSETKRMVLIK